MPNSIFNPKMPLEAKHLFEPDVFKEKLPYKIPKPTPMDKMVSTVYSDWNKAKEGNIGKILKMPLDVMNVGVMTASNSIRNLLPKGIIRDAYDYIAPNNLPQLAMLGMFGPTDDAVASVAEKTIEPVAEKLAGELGETMPAKIFKNIVWNSIKKGVGFGAVSGAGTAMSNVIYNRPFTQDVGNAALLGGAVGMAINPASMLYTHTVGTAYKGLTKYATKGIKEAYKLLPDSLKDVLKVTHFKTGNLVNVLHSVTNSKDKEEISSVLMHSQAYKFFARAEAQTTVHTLETHYEPLLAKIGEQLGTTPAGAFEVLTEKGLWTTEDIPNTLAQLGIRADPDRVEGLKDLQAYMKSVYLSPIASDAKINHAYIGSYLNENNREKYLNSRAGKRLISELQKRPQDLDRELKAYKKEIDSIDAIKKKTVNDFIDAFKRANPDIPKETIEVAREDLLTSPDAKSLRDKMNYYTSLVGRDEKIEANLAKLGYDAVHKLDQKLDEIKTSQQRTIEKYSKRIDTLLNRLQTATEKETAVPFEHYLSRSKSAMTALMPRKVEAEYFDTMRGKKLDWNDVADMLSRSFSHQDTVLSLLRTADILNRAPLPKEYWYFTIMTDYPAYFDTKEKQEALKNILSKLPQVVYDKDEAVGQISQVLGGNKAQAEKIFNEIYQHSFANLKAEMPPDVELNMPRIGTFYFDRTTKNLFNAVIGRREIEGGLMEMLNKALTASKRLMLSFSLFHFKTEEFSALYAEQPMVFREMIMNDKDFFKLRKELLENYVIPLENRMRQEGLKFNANFSREISFAKFNEIKNIPLLGKALDWVDTRLWDRLYTMNKLLGVKKVAEDVANGRLSLVGAQEALNELNIFFGGLNELNVYATPLFRSLLRVTFFAPDWELALIKQLGYAVTGKNYDYVRYFANILGYNFVINQLIAQFAGKQHRWDIDFLDRMMNDPSFLFQTTVRIGNHDYIWDSAGFEFEMLKTFYRPLKALYQHGINGFVPEALYAYQSKSSPLVKFITDMYKVASEPSKNPPTLFFNMFLPLSTSDLKPNQTPSEAFNVMLINNLGMRASELKIGQSVINAVTTPEELLPDEVNRIVTQIKRFHITPITVGYAIAYEEDPFFINDLAQEYAKFYDYAYKEHQPEKAREVAMNIISQIKQFAEKWKKKIQNGTMYQEYVNGLCQYYSMDCNKADARMPVMGKKMMDNFGILYAYASPEALIDSLWKITQMRARTVYRRKFY